MTDVRTTATGLATSGALVLTFILKECGIEVPTEVQIAIVTIGIAVLGYFSRDRNNKNGEETK